jgi:hypothetical protein
MKEDDKQTSAAVARVTRRPYAAPAIEETSEFETLALTCAVAQQQCGPGYPPQPPEYYDQS